MKLWKRFIDWLHYLRHPSFVARFGNPSAENTPRTYSTVTGMSEWPPFHQGGEIDAQAIADVLTDRYKSGKSLTDCVMEEAEMLVQERNTNILPAIKRMNEREKEEEKLTILWEIAQELAYVQDYDEATGELIECAFCSIDIDPDDPKHEPTCIVTKARELLGQKEKNEQEDKEDKEDKEGQV